MAAAGDSEEARWNEGVRVISWCSMCELVDNFITDVINPTAVAKAVDRVLERERWDADEAKQLLVAQMTGVAHRDRVAVEVMDKRYTMTLGHFYQRLCGLIKYTDAAGREVRIVDLGRAPPCGCDLARLVNGEPVEYIELKMRSNTMNSSSGASTVAHLCTHVDAGLHATLAYVHVDGTKPIPRFKAPQTVTVVGGDDFFVHLGCPRGTKYFIQQALVAAVRSIASHDTAKVGGDRVAEALSE